ncbi:hypothetical protein EXIGLDRAFT_752079 [Exidia glandulosa HHB12029]|uniref:DUF6593 domain-containing protein n=1 Tax=Exidia glandulosa HHB12029 TaxID=1314781 RepID=A0A165EUL6_EXIGL|nr:hypothetical protein EXIGLDRAFT_752079 [Exidia glandulosa HHB12029]
MDFTLSHNSPYTTQLVGAEVSYDVQSRNLTRHTTIRRDDATIAEIDWHNFKATTVVMDGEEFKLSDFLKGPSSMTMKREFSLNGSTYVWSSHLKSLRLERDGEKIAEFERHTFRKSKLHVSQAAEKILDFVIVTFICVWREETEMTVALSAS